MSALVESQGIRRLHAVVSMVVLSFGISVAAHGQVVVDLFNNLRHYSCPGDLSVHVGNGSQLTAYGCAFGLWGWGTADQCGGASAGTVVRFHNSEPVWAYLYLTLNESLPQGTELGF